MTFSDNDTQPLQKLWMVLFSLIILHSMMPFVGRFISTFFTTYLLLGVVLMIVYYFVQWEFSWWSNLLISLILIDVINLLYGVSHGQPMTTALYGELLSFCPVLIGLRILSLPSDQTKTLFKVAAIALIITSLTTIRGLQIFPGASRMLATFQDSNNPLLIQFEWNNIGGFSFTYLLLTIYPIIIGYVREMYNKIWVKILLIWLFATYFISAEYATALTGFVLISSLWFVPKNFSYKKLFTLLGVVLVFFLIFKSILASLLYDFAGAINSNTLQARFLYMADGVSGVENTSSVGLREDLLMTSLKNFLHSPVVGNWTRRGGVGGHSYILDFISLYGIIGLILIIKSYKVIFTTFYVQYKDTPFYSYALMSFITAIILSIVNTGNHWFELTLLVPLAMKTMYHSKSVE